MKMLRKRIDCESFKNSQKTVYDEVCFSKILSVWCTDNSYAIIQYTTYILH